MSRTFFEKLREELDSAMARDPAARSRLEVFLTYPSVHAILIYRLAHRLWRAEWRLLAKMLSQFARFITGIEIHPGAVIGERFFADHGAGIVIGETSIIGNDVTLYQHVSLGGVLPSVNSATQKGQKRHPTLGNGVIVGAGAQVLGDIVVSDGARVGANAVVLNDVPAGVVVVGIPAKIVAPKDSCCDFAPYGIPSEGIADPMVRIIDQLTEKMNGLQARVEELEGKNGQSMAGEAAHGIELRTINGRNPATSERR